MSELEIVISVDLIKALFAGKWRFDVVRNLCDGPQRLSTLRRLIPNAPKKMLIDTIRSLEQRGWVTRTDKSAELRHVEYSLSEEWATRIRTAVCRVSLVASPTQGDGSLV